MKAAKRARLIREAVAAGKRVGERPMTYASVDLKTGMPDFPHVISFPVDPVRFMREGRFTVDLFAIGYRLERLGKDPTP